MRAMMTPPNLPRVPWSRPNARIRMLRISLIDRCRLNPGSTPPTARKRQNWIRDPAWGRMSRLDLGLREWPVSARLSLAARTREGPLLEPIAGTQPCRRDLLFMLRVFGRLPVTDSATRSEGRRPKSLKGGNRGGEFAPAVVWVYGDSAPVDALMFRMFRLRTGTRAEQLLRRWFWSRCAAPEQWSRGERYAFWRSKAVPTVAVGGG